MKRVWLVLSILVFLTQVGCNSDPKDLEKEQEQEQATGKSDDYYQDVGDWKVPRPVFSGEKLKHITRPAVEIINGEPAVLYSADKKIELMYKGKKTVIESTEGSTKVWLFTDKSKNKIYTLWWKKTPKGKYVYFRGSSDEGKTFSKKSVININGGILQQLKLYSHGDGNIAVLFYDERVPPYRVYANASTDGGLTWKETDFRIDNDLNAINKKGKNGENVPVNYALNPLLAYLDTGKLVASWQQRKVIDNKLVSQIVVRISNDLGQSWGEEQTVFTWDKAHIVEAAMVSRGNKIAIIAGYPKIGLLGFYAEDNKASNQLSWKELDGVNGTQEVNEISWLKPVMSDDVLKVGFILQKEQKNKYQIQIASMPFVDQKWETKPFRIDRDKKQPVKTKASYFDLKLLPNGEFVIAWQDYRSIIPMLMLDYTKNKGKDWLDHPVEATRPGLSQIRLPEVYVGGGMVRVNLEWNIIRDTKLPRYSTLEFPLDPKTGVLSVAGRPADKQYTKEEKEAKLRKRVEEFMSLRVKGEWEKSWAYMDPVYRQVTKKSSWLKNMGNISYESFKVNKVDAEGRFATAEVDMMVSLAQQLRQGEVVEATPAKKSSTTMKWLWFYDDWYFFSSGTFFQYLKY